MKDEKYLELLAEKYPTEQAVCREIINLKSNSRSSKRHGAFYERPARRI